MKLSAIAAMLCGFAAIAAAQTVTSHRSFEAASIKASPLSEGTDSDFNPGRLRMQGTLKAMVRVAYEVSNDRIEGGPKWLDEDHYEINAKAEGPAEDDELREMLRNLLAERFGFQFHRVTRTVSAYSLTIAPGGLKMRESSPSDSHSTHGGRGTLAAKNVQIARLADRLSNLLSVPVVDGTGNSAFYDFTLTWSAESTNLSATGRGSDESGPSIFTALQEQLGLKLEHQKVPVEFLVIDRATRPPLN